MGLRGQKNYVKVESGPLPLGGSGTFSVLRATLSRCTVVIDEDTLAGLWHPFLGFGVTGCTADPMSEGDGL